MLTKGNIIIGVLVVVCGLLAVSMLKGWYKPAPVVNSTSYTQAPQIKEVVKIQRVEVPGPPVIQTIEKTTIVERLKLPDEIAKNSSKNVIATGVIDPYEGKTNVIGILDSKTGEGSIITKQEPLPLFAFKNSKEIGARGGIGLHGQEANLYGRYTFFRIGSFHVAAYGEIGGSQTGPAQGRALLDVSYRWE